MSSRVPSWFRSCWRRSKAWAGCPSCRRRRSSGEVAEELYVIGKGCVAVDASGRRQGGENAALDGQIGLVKFEKLQVARKHGGSNPLRPLHSRTWRVIRVLPREAAGHRNGCMVRVL